MREFLRKQILVSAGIRWQTEQPRRDIIHMTVETCSCSQLEDAIPTKRTNKNAETLPQAIS